MMAKKKAVSAAGMGAARHWRESLAGWAARKTRAMKGWIKNLRRPIDVGYFSRETKMHLPWG